jgi:hypothetical protein
LGDSDDEDKTKDLKAEDTERLKKKASEVPDVSPIEGETPKLQEAKRSGSLGQKDETAEKLLAGKEVKP